MSAVLTVAGKEILEASRNRWVAAATLLLAALALALAFLGSAPTGVVGVQALDVVIVSLSSLTIFLVPLIALLIAHDAIVGEAERGVMLLLLSYPIDRRQILLGKFIGHLAVLAFATIAGYSAAALALIVGGAPVDAQSVVAFAAMIGASVMLGAVFLALGYLVSALSRSSAAAAGAAIGIWLGVVVLYDMALLGLLVVDQGRVVSSSGLNALLLLNPADVYRLINLTGFANVSAFSGMAGLAGATALTPGVLIAALLAWIAVPLGLAALAFSRREL